MALTPSAAGNLCCRLQGVNRSERKPEDACHACSCQVLKREGETWQKVRRCHLIAQNVKEAACWNLQQRKANPTVQPPHTALLDKSGDAFAESPPELVLVVHGGPCPHQYRYLPERALCCAHRRAHGLRKDIRVVWDRECAQPRR
eukprot:CAMPEP_0197570622 /NCGR_PEP_ID=MMETSP1320-20131121/41014_1 /TAXON_ID=91990 /ORGANISM="Bolidomonas sp., Strain RCC2347" /LENGTH=144 /DNA_ID=CAMNT_0043133063 /DNA_START=333 /DNA_END=762 /DNA_ORIENTATION=-